MVSKGIAYALGACLLWGLIFIIPLYMEGFSPIEIALGRYLVYGTLSLIILAKAMMQGSCYYPLPIWGRAIAFSFVLSLGYYPALILSIRYANAAVAALVAGLAPIAIAFYGNLRERECSFRALVLPSLLILCGLIMINVPYMHASAASSDYLLGLGCGLLSLCAWVSYVVANSRFLKKNPQIASADWTTLIGVGTLFWTAFSVLIIGLFYIEYFDPQRYHIDELDFAVFVVGCVILGLICSWLAQYCWNKASLYLPVSLAGQVTVCETIFAICFVYAVEQRLPPQKELLGIALFLLAVVFALRGFAKSRNPSLD